MSVSRLRNVGVVAVTALVLSGCAAGSTASLSSPRSKPRTITLTERDNGHRVQARVGDRIVITLHSTYWQLQPTHGQVLSLLDNTGTPTATPSCPSIPGTGCGIVTSTYRVLTSGTATVSAQRTSCGEALRCSPAQSSWRVTVTAR
jgi:hypothetical protein